MMVSIFQQQSIFKLRYILFFFFKTQCWCSLNRLYYIINITFLCTGKPKNLCNSLYCDICFIAMAWNPTCSVSKVTFHGLGLQSPDSWPQGETTWEDHTAADLPVAWLRSLL